MTPEEKILWVQRYAQAQQDIRDSGANSPYAELLLTAAASPLHGGAVSKKAFGILESTIQTQAWANRFAGTPHPKINPAHAVSLGKQENGEDLNIPFQILCMHVLLIGPTGAGKTSFSRFLVDQLVNKHAIKIIWHCAKDDGRKLLHNYPSTVVLPITWLPMAFLHPPTDKSETYYSSFAVEMARAFSIRPETAPKMVSLLLRLEAGLEPNTPYLSLKDFEILLRKYGVQTGEGWAITTARAFTSLNSVLGEASRIRKGYKLDDEKIVVYESQGLSPRMSSLVSALRLSRLQMRLAAAGHDESLKRVIIIDEAGIELGKELSSAAGSNYISFQRRLLSQIRSTGTGVVASFQSPADADNSTKANVGTVVCMGIKTASDSREMCQLLNLPLSRANELDLPVGHAWVKTALCPDPIRVTIPNCPAGNYIGSTELEKLMASTLQRIRSQCVYSTVKDPTETPIDYLDFLGDNKVEHKPTPPKVDPNEFSKEKPAVLAEWAAFLGKALDHPDVGVKELYRILNWSDSKGNRVRKTLLKNGLITSKKIANTSKGGRPLTATQVKEKGQAFLRAYKR